MTRGKQVIIPNYLQGVSNCIINRPHYRICCVNECEAILGDIEASVGAPLGQPGDILELVGNMTSYDDDPPKLDEALRGQLQRVAETHGGKIPLHGRLFAQWLHYAFPRECPFPHKAGHAKPTAPEEFGDHAVVTPEEVEQIVHRDRIAADGAEESAGAEDSPWMT